MGKPEIVQSAAPATADKAVLVQQLGAVLPPGSLLHQTEDEETVSVLDAVFLNRTRHVRHQHIRFTTAGQSIAQKTFNRAPHFCRWTRSRQTPTHPTDRFLLRASQAIQNFRIHAVAAHAIRACFHCPSRCAISAARFSSSRPSSTERSPGSARQYTPDVRAFTSGSLSARVVK